MPRYCLKKSEQSRETPLHLSIHKLLLWIQASRYCHKRFIPQKTSCESWKSDRQMLRYCLTKSEHGPVVMWWGWTFRNKNDRCTHHHVIRADLPEQKIRWTCHHMMRVDLLEQKIPVDLPSRDEDGPFGTRNSGGPVITRWGRTFRNKKIPVDLLSHDEGGPGGPSRKKIPVDLLSIVPGPIFN